MKENNDDTVEIFAIWEYDSYEAYVEIESKVRSDIAHLKRANDWYEKKWWKRTCYKGIFF